MKWCFAGAVAAAALLAAACTDAPTAARSGAIPIKPSFAPGGSISVNLDQCANNVPRGGDCTWQNGDLNGSNSEYAEGLTVPFRLSVDGLTIGVAYQIHINYDWTAGGHKAYDFLASHDATEQVAICAAGGGGVPLACPLAAVTPDAKDIPENSFPSNLYTPPGPLSVTGAIAFAASAPGGGFVVAGERKLRLYKGTINSITEPTHIANKGVAITDPADLTGNTTADILVTFTPSATSVLFTWSGHLAQSAYWDQPGTPNGAGQVSGAPWHMRTQQLQTASGTSAGNKNQDRSIQPSALIEPPVMDVSKNADAATVSAGSAIGFTVLVHNTGGGPAEGFVLNDPLPTGSGISWSIDNQSGPVTCSVVSNVLRCPASGTATFPAGGTLSVHVTSATTFASCGVYNNTATVSITNGASPSPAIAQTTVQCPLLGITKTADAASVSAGSAIGFTITVSNTGAGTATGVTLSDALPGGSGVDWSISPSVTGCSISGSAPTQTLGCTLGNLAQGASVQIHLTSGTTSASCKAYPNTATAQATNHAQVSASATTTVNCGDIEILKTPDATSVNAGEAIGFTISVHNKGAGNATGVVLTDVLPVQAGVSWSVDGGTGAASCSISSGTLTCNFGTMAPNATLTVHIASGTTEASCTTITNTGSVTTTNDGSASSTANVVVKCPNLSLTKVADATPVNAGSPIGFLITVTNNGTGVAKNVTISDALPTGSGIVWSDDSADCSITSNVLSCNFGDLASGASRSVHLTSPTTEQSCKAYPNTATADADNNPAVTASSSITVQCPDISVSKTADAATVNAGSPIGFLITVSNAGPGLAKDVTLNDPLPTGTGIVWGIDGGTGAASCGIASDVLSCSFGDLAAGASLTVHVSSATTAQSCKAYPNTATADASNDAPVTASATTTVECASIAITKVADAASVSAGDPIGFTITVTNNGAGSATNVTVNDALPTNTGLSWTIDGGANAGDCSISSGNLSCNFGTMASGASKTVHISSPTVAASCGLVSNTAFVTTGNDGNANASASVTVNCPDISVVKTAGNGTVNAGDPVSFTILVTNNGLGTAKNVTLNDPLPSGLTWTDNSGDCDITAGLLTCSFGDMAPGASKSVTVSAVSAAANCGTLPNTVTVAATNEADGDKDDNTSTATIQVNCGDIQITKTADASPVSAGDAIGFLISVHNNGAGSATGVTMTDPLPTQAGLSWSVDGGTGAGSCSISLGTLTCNFGTMAAGATLTVHITSPTTAASCATIPNQASVSTTNDGSANASASVVVRCPSLQITKTADAATVSAGGTIGFTITVSNSGAAGTGVAKSVTLTDALPTGTGITWSQTPPVAGCSISSNTLTCNLGDLAAGASVQVHLSSPTTTESCKAYPNNASAQATNNPVVQASATTTVLCPQTTGRIAPTATTCSDFVSGSGDLAELFAGLNKSGNINNVAPGVFFYYTLVEAPAGASFTVGIQQSNSGPAGWPNFAFKQGQVVLYNANCTKNDTQTITTSANDTQALITIAGAATGTKFIVGVKYETGAPVGFSGASLPVTYTYKTAVNGSVLGTNTDAIVLKAKP
jgi:uncharacterized repeat protein (TIGR01451 family)